MIILSFPVEDDTLNFLTNPTDKRLPVLKSSSLYLICAGQVLRHSIANYNFFPSILFFLERFIHKSAVLISSLCFNYHFLLVNN